MQLKNDSKSTLAREIQIVPGWAWGLAGIAFIAALWYFNIAIARHPHAPPIWVRPLFGLLAGLGGGAYLLLIGYVNRDSKRRGMSPVLWTLVAILVPNAMGILLYFVLRQPQRIMCPQCGHAVQTEFNFCPRCSYKLGPSCPQCQRVVGGNDDFCPYCGTSLHNQPPPASSHPANVPH